MNNDPLQILDDSHAPDYYDMAAVQSVGSGIERIE
jgi:hypothetical protein